MRLAICGFFIAIGQLLYGQTNFIKENLGPTVNSEKDQILPVVSRDGTRLYFSENTNKGNYEIWYSELATDSTWLPKKRAQDLNPPTQGSKYVFAVVNHDLLLVNGWFEKVVGKWTQRKGLSWYIPSEKRYVKLDIPAIQTEARGRFVNVFIHHKTKRLVLSYAKENERDLYICSPQNPDAHWVDLAWKWPQKLPQPINSAFDDTTPYMDEDGTRLYFASNRPG